MGVDLEYDGHVDRWDRDIVAQHAAEEVEAKARKAMQGDAGADSGSGPDAGAALKPKAVRQKR
jgi:hypothetical protein